MICVVTLPASASYANRSATFVRVSHPGFPIVGVVEIREASGRGRPNVSRYALREEPVDHSRDRRFRLTKPGGAEVYYVCLALSGHDFNRCECKGYESHGRCKHIDALDSLERGGHFGAEAAPVLPAHLVKKES